MNCAAVTDCRPGLLPSGSELDLSIGTDLAESAGVKPSSILSESGNADKATLPQDGLVSKPGCCEFQKENYISPESLPPSSHSIRPTFIEPSSESKSNQIVQLAVFRQLGQQLPSTSSSTFPDHCELLLDSSSTYLADPSDLPAPAVVEAAADRGLPSLEFLPAGESSSCEEADQWSDVSTPAEEEIPAAALRVAAT